MKLISCYRTVDKNMSYFGNIRPPPPEYFSKTVKQQIYVFHLLFAGTDFKTSNTLKSMLEMFNNILFVICHKVTNYYSRIP